MAVKEKKSADIKDPEGSPEGGDAQTAVSERPAPLLPSGQAGFAASYNQHAAYLTGGCWLVLLLSERVMDSTEGFAKLLSGLATAGLAVALGQRIWAMNEASPDRKPGAKAFTVLSALGLLAALGYFTTTEWGRDLLGVAPPKLGEPDTFGEVMTIVWIGLLVVSLLATFLGELARRSMQGAERVESQRILAAVVAGVSLGLAAIYGSLFVYSTSELEIKADFSYFRTAKPSEATANALASTEQPVTAYAFIPRFSEVHAEVMSYLNELSAMAPDKLVVEGRDPELFPEVAKEHKIRQGGVVLLTRGEQSAQFDVGVDLKQAGPKLKKLDGEFQKALLEVLRDTRTAYLTIGHGELNTQPDGKTGTMRKLLEGLNYKVKDLGMKEGLGSEIPDDADVVLVLGPSDPLFPAEIDSLKRYADSGGSLYLALDPNAGKADHDPLAAIVGLSWQGKLVLNDHVYLRAGKPSDKQNIGVGRFSSHASVSTLSKLAGRGGVVLFGSAPLEKRKDADKGLQIDFTLKSPPNSYIDLDDKFTFDSATEKRDTLNLAAAVSRPVAKDDDSGASEMRAFVIGDADYLRDQWFVYTAQRLLFAEAIRWLGRESSFTGEISSEEDHPIVHTKEEDKWWFYSTILGVPGLVLGLGLLFTRKRGIREEQKREQDRPPRRAQRGRKKKAPDRGGKPRRKAEPSAKPDEAGAKDGEEPSAAAGEPDDEEPGAAAGEPDDEEPGAADDEPESEPESGQGAKP